MTTTTTTTTTTAYHRNKCAGGIIIDPWDDISNHLNYKLLLVKQRYGDFWGLPKGHVENGENILTSAIREIYEETGMNLLNMNVGIDYDEITLDHTKQNKNLIVIKKIYLFVYVLLKKINNFKQKYPHSHEIADIRWFTLLEIQQMILTQQSNVKFNRTINNDALTTIENVCLKVKEQIQQLYQSASVASSTSSSTSTTIADGSSTTTTTAIQL